MEQGKKVHIITIMLSLYFPTPYIIHSRGIYPKAKELLLPPPITLAHQPLGSERIGNPQQSMMNGM
jgi:hypothetical protein